jgi:hypothetical protein
MDIFKTLKIESLRHRKSARKDKMAKLRNTPEEEAAIQRGIDQDPDNPEWTADDFAKARRLGDRVKLPTPGAMGRPKG